MGHFAITSPHSRGVTHYFSSPLVDQAFSNYAAMTKEDCKILADRIAKFHRDTHSQNPFREQSQ